MEAQFARMRLRLNFMSDDICFRTVMCGQTLKNALYIKVVRGIINITIISIIDNNLRTVLKVYSLYALINLISLLEQPCLARKPFEPALARMRLPQQKQEDIPLYTLSCVGRNSCERALTTYPFTNLISTDIPVYDPLCVDKSCAKTCFFVCAYN